MSEDGPARDLKTRLLARIAADGPMSVGAYMAEALHDPRAGYYATKDPIGAGGDYVTAPEISQMFGELVGVWCVQAWLDLGEPSPVHLIELGPGRGAMMADMLRAARVRADFLAACEATLVETSPALKAAQAARLADAPIPVMWAASLAEAPIGPAIIVGNEFLDCLPVRQFVRVEGAWRERMVARDPADADALAFVLAPLPAPDADVALIPDHVRAAEDGALVEIRPSAAAVVDALAARAPTPFRALFFDYGPFAAEIGDTLQALKDHAKTDPLAAPGEADLTARVDFGAFAQTAAAAGLDAAGPVEQRDWLGEMGLEARAAALMAHAPDAKRALAAQIVRLTDPAHMGALFKAICVSSPELRRPAGFRGQPRR